MYNRMSVFKPTQNNWHDSYVMSGLVNGVKNQPFVEVRYHGNICPTAMTPVYRTSVWGTDDHAMTFDGADPDEVFAKFLTLLELEFVNQRNLEYLGFVRF